MAVISSYCPRPARILASGVLVLFVYAAQGQFNDTTFYQAKYTATGIFNRTDEGRSYASNNEARFLMSKQRISLGTGLKHVYGQQDAKKINNDFNGTLDLDYRRNTHRLFYFAQANYDKSFSMAITHRFQGGAGLGLNLLKTANTNITVTNGILYEYAELYTAPVNITARNSLQLRFRFLIKERFVIEGNDLYQQSLDNQHDYILKSVTNLGLKLNRWLSFAAGLEYNQLNLTNRQNLLCNFGLMIEKYF